MGRSTHVAAQWGCQESLDHTIGRIVPHKDGAAGLAGFSADAGEDVVGDVPVPGAHDVHAAGVVETHAGVRVLPWLVAAAFRTIVVEQAALHAAAVDEGGLPVLVGGLRSLDEPLPYVVTDDVVDGHTIYPKLDLVQILQAGKYRTGEPATVTEGDINGDGLSNRLDLVFALQNGNYETYITASSTRSL